ncbi:MAG: HDOD domain-containing protein [Myxococcaceae bacterium]
MTSHARLNPSYGRGEAVIDDLGVAVDSNTLGERVGMLFSRPQFKAPMLPAMAVQVITISRKPNVTIGELVEVISHDAMITADVLKLAHSPMYSRSTPARTLKEAAARMGIRGVQSLVLETLQRVIFKSPTMGPSLEAVRKHGSVVGHLSRLVARQTAFDAEFAFVCGLLHEIGISAGLMALGEDRSSVLDAEQWYALEKSHEHAASLLSRLWQLPPELSLVISSHHAPAKELPHRHPVASVLALAEHLAAESGFGLVPLLAKCGLTLPESLEQPVPARAGAARAQLRLSDAVYAQLHHDAAAVVEQLSQHE